MKIKIQRLYIGDFGIIRNQILEQIEPGMVVIGGLNRAGKSTLMQLLRYLGYGFPRGAFLPPPHTQYEVEADLNWSGSLCNLRLAGHGEPVFTAISGAAQGKRSVENPYSLDGFSYRQLFTISLDELNSLEHLAGEKKRQLQSILLGAGLKEVALLPGLEREFFRAADKIGGTRGNPKVRAFKPYLENIEEGQKLKARGLAQEQAYVENQEKRQVIELQLKQLSEKLAESKGETLRLDLVKSNFENYARIEQLGQELALRRGERWERTPSAEQLEEVEKLRQSCAALRRDLKARQTALGLSPELRQDLLAEKESLALLSAGRSGIEERLRRFGEDSERQREQKDSLSRSIREVNSRWDAHDFREPDSFRADSIEQQKLTAQVENYQSLTASRDKLAAELAQLQAHNGSISADLEKIREGADSPDLGRYAYLLGAIALLGTVLTLFNPLLGVLPALAGFIGLTAYYLTTGAKRQKLEAVIQSQEERLRAGQVEVELKAAALKKTEQELKGQEQAFEDYRRVLNLESSVRYSRLPEYLNTIRVLRGRSLELTALQERLLREEQELEGAYRRYVALLSKFSPREQEQEAQNIQEKWPGVFLSLARWEEKLKKAEEIAALRQRIAGAEGEAAAIMEKSRPLQPGTDFLELADLFLNEGRKAWQVQGLEQEWEQLLRTIANLFRSDALRRAFRLGDSPLEEDPKAVLRAFAEQCRPFATAREAEEAHLAALEAQEELERQLEEAKREMQEVLSAHKRFAAQEDVYVGQQKIAHNRGALKVKAEEYAVKMLSSVLLQEVEQNLLRAMKDSLMSGAGKIFKRLTQGEYEGIQPAEPLFEADLEVLAKDRAEPRTVQMLSRGTKEQLYLSVRLSRIMEIEPRLPVIIDDSLANFDSRHLDQSALFFSELARTHQIFVLTCHARLLENLEKTGVRIQYWKLEEGRFSEAEYGELLKYLS